MLTLLYGTQALLYEIFYIVVDNDNRKEHGGRERCETLLVFVLGVRQLFGITEYEANQGYEQAVECGGTQGAVIHRKVDVHGHCHEDGAFALNEGVLPFVGGKLFLGAGGGRKS